MALKWQKRAGFHCHYVFHRQWVIITADKCKAWMCSFRSSSSATCIPNVNQSAGFQLVKITMATLALREQVFSCKSLEDRNFGTGIFHEIWMKYHLDEKRHQKGQKKTNLKNLLQVQTAFKTLKLHVPSPATVLYVADVEELVFLLDSSTAASFDDLKTVENTSPSQRVPSLSGRPSDLTCSTAAY